MPSSAGVPFNKGAATASATPPVSGTKSITRTSSSLQDKMIGRMLGKARLLKRLGRGGMGDVYLAQHVDYAKAVAIKILPPDLTRNEELLQRFRREAQTAGRLDHPNLVEIYDVGEESGFHYIIMAYVDGLNLQEYLDDHGKLDPREAVRIAGEVARGLQAVHAEKIIHRDIKPANILISTKGEVKIVDFGLAFDAEDKTTLTVAGAVMGTPWYLSPEQAEGRRADPRSDVYSLGVCLYLMLCGARPFVGETHMAVLYKQIHEKPRDPRLHRPDMPDYLADIILKCLEKKAEKRFASAAELGKAMDLFIKGTYPKKAVSSFAPTPIARPVDTAPLKPAAEAPAPEKKGRSRLLTFAVAGWAALLLAAILGVFFVSSGGSASDEAYDELLKQAALAEVKGELDAAQKHYQDATKIRSTAETREGLERIEARTKPSLPPAEPLDPAAFRGLLNDYDQRQIAGRDYVPVIKRLLERHHAEKSPAVKAAISRVGLKLSSAAKVTAQYRGVISAEKQPALKLRDGRVISYAFTPVPAIHADTIVEYARKSREITELDLAFFLLVDGEALAALDHVILGRDIRPECRLHLDDIVETALAQKKDAREIADRLAAAREKLGAAAAAAVEAARSK